MPSLDPERLRPLFQLYLQLGGGVLLGWVLGRLMPRWIPTFIGQFLFWIGVPISIITFLRGADLSGKIWIAPIAAWVAILLGALLAWFWIKGGGKFAANHGLTNDTPSEWNKPTQGSFLLASMVGNTGYLGFPINLTLLGENYFGWALFYDMLGTLLGAYGLGVVLAARFGRGSKSQGQLVRSLVINPALWSMGIGLELRQVPLPGWLEVGMEKFAWSAIALSLVLIGMRLSQLASWRKVKQAGVGLGIKMLLIPLVLGMALSQFGIVGKPQLAIVLQMAMPPAFATLVIAEVYELDRELTVTALAVGSIGLLLTLPIWLLLFGA
ncbi:MAG: AEC family transporter [Coleofasciculus chthonoplastes F3-SA18-01]|jgi:predicted permease|uniref:AEC family transporter n=1 Tax=Coleofasciculus chthonoplastes TaxID=64178 RepID=UPI0032F3576C